MEEKLRVIVRVFHLDAVRLRVRQDGFYHVQFGSALVFPPQVSVNVHRLCWKLRRGSQSVLGVNWPPDVDPLPVLSVLRLEAESCGGSRLRSGALRR